MDQSDPPTDIPVRVPEITRELADQIYESPTHNVIEAATGSGKTYAAAIAFKAYVEKGRPAVYVAANKVQLFEFAFLLADMYGFNTHNIGQDDCDDHLATKGIVMKYHRGTASDQSSSTDSRGSIGPDVKFVLTLHHYLHPEGDGVQFAQFLARWHNEKLKPVIIVDEADHCITSTYTVLQLDQRYPERRHKGDTPYYPRTSICPMNPRSRSQSCANCHSRKNTVQWESNTYGHFLFKHAGALDHINEAKLLTNTDQFQHNETEIRNGTFRMSLLKDETERFLAFKLAGRSDDLEDQLHDPEKILEERIKMAGMVALLTVHPTVEGVQVDPDTIPTDRKERRQMKIVYPTQPCESRFLIIQDMSPLVVLERVASRVVLLSASYDDNVLRVIDRGFSQPVPKVTITPPEERKVGKLSVILTPDSFTGHNHPGSVEALSRLSRTLVFEPTQSLARKWDHCIGTIVGATIWDGDSFIHKVGGNPTTDDTTPTELQYRLLVAYANSALGRGVNAPQYRTAIIDAGIHMPTVATKVDPENFTSEAINQAKGNVRIEKLKQCSGRILRHDTLHSDDGRRVLLIHGIPVEDGEVVVPQEALEMISKMAEEATVHWFKKGSQAIEGTIRYWKGEDVGGDANPPDMHTETYVKERKRALNRERRLQERLQDWSAWVREGIEWREFLRKANVNRYKKRWGEDQYRVFVVVLKLDVEAGELLESTKQIVIENESGREI